MKIQAGCCIILLFISYTLAQACCNSGIPLPPGGSCICTEDFIFDGTGSTVYSNATIAATNIYISDPMELLFVDCNITASNNIVFSSQYLSIEQSIITSAAANITGRETIIYSSTIDIEDIAISSVLTTPVAYALDITNSTIVCSNIDILADGGSTSNSGGLKLENTYIKYNQSANIIGEANNRTAVLIQESTLFSVDDNIVTISGSLSSIGFESIVAFIAVGSPQSFPPMEISVQTEGFLNAVYFEGTFQFNQILNIMVPDAVLSNSRGVVLDGVFEILNCECVIQTYGDDSGLVFNGLVLLSDSTLTLESYGKLNSGVQLQGTISGVNNNIILYGDVSASFLNDTAGVQILDSSISFENSTLSIHGVVSPFDSASETSGVSINNSTIITAAGYIEIFGNNTLNTLSPNGYGFFGRNSLFESRASGIFQIQGTVSGNGTTSSSGVYLIEDITLDNVIVFGTTEISNRTEGVKIKDGYLTVTNTTIIGDANNTLSSFYNRAGISIDSSGFKLDESFTLRGSSTCTQNCTGVIVLSSEFVPPITPNVQLFITGSSNQGTNCFGVVLSESTFGKLLTTFVDGIGNTGVYIEDTELDSDGEYRGTAIGGVNGINTASGIGIFMTGEIDIESDVNANFIGYSTASHGIMIISFFDEINFGSKIILEGHGNLIVSDILLYDDFVVNYCDFEVFGKIIISGNVVSPDIYATTVIFHDFVQVNGNINVTFPDATLYFLDGYDSNIIRLDSDIVYLCGNCTQSGFFSANSIETACIDTLEVQITSSDGESISFDYLNGNASVILNGNQFNFISVSLIVRITEQ